MEDTDPAVYLFLIILGVGCALVVISTLLIWSGMRTIGWKLTHAYVENSEYSGTDKQTWSGMLVGHFFGFLSLAPSHKALINYRYFISEKQFFGNRVQIGMLSSSNRNHIENILKQNSVNSVIEIYYNPSDPKQNVIKKGPSSDSIKLLILGMIMVCVGGYVSSAFLALI